MPMTVNGTLTKLFFMSLIMLCAGGATWYNFAIGAMDKVNLLLTAGVIIGTITGFAICFFRKTTPFLLPIYAFSEGTALAGISCIFESTYPGIVVKAVSLTFLALFSMLFLYMTRIIKPTDRMRSIITSATMAICIFYLINMVLILFHVNLPMLAMNDSSMLSIGISVVITIIAAFNLVLDFEFIEKGVENCLPKENEWFGAFGLLVTLVWLYMEILRLLVKLNNRK
jgi:uncharacterized YccA/Bax inhibitor family protein